MAAKSAFHARSNSFPSGSHPLVVNVEDHVLRLKASEEATTSSSICRNLSSLKQMHGLLNDLIQLPSVQQTLSSDGCEKWSDEILDGSLRLLDVCGTARDALLLMKESMQELESSIRRKRGEESSLAEEIKTYMITRKKINKLVSKSIKSLKNYEKSNSSAISDKDAIICTLREAETISFSVLKSVLSYVSGTDSGSKQSSSWSLVSKFIRPKHDSSDVLKQLPDLEKAIQELEEGLEPMFRCLVKTRVSLLNVLNH